MESRDRKTHEDLRWYAVYVRARFEKKVLGELVSRQVEAFLPTYQEPKTWRNGCRVVTECPLFPGYMFAKTNLSNTRQVLSTPGVVYLVGRGSLPVAIEEAEILGLMAATQSGKAVPHSFLTTGQDVEITAGPLAGMKGFLLQMRNSFRVIVSVDLIKRSLSVEVEREFIAPLRTEVHECPVGMRVQDMKPAEHVIAG